MNEIELSEIQKLALVYRAARTGNMVRNLVLFCRLLKNLKINLTLGRIIDMVRSLDHIDITEKRFFYHTLRANLISYAEEYKIFDEAFDIFWEYTGEMENAEETQSMAVEIEEPPPDLPGQDQNIEEVIKKEFQIGDDEQYEEDDSVSDEDLHEYSTNEILKTKDFSAFTDSELEIIKKIIVQLVTKMGTKKSRRKQIHHKGREISLRHSLRLNLKYGGEFIELARRRKKIKKMNLIAMTDVSGSMDAYSKFFVQFIYALQNKVSGVEGFAFSTSITRITEELKKRNMKDALEAVSKIARHWSGGTNIGACFGTFNSTFAPVMLNNKSIVMILSDGWDRGDSEVLEREIKKIKKTAHCIIWLNPLLGSKDYQPLCKGIATVLPHLNYFLPLHNLESLKALTRTLKSVM